jgi:hypothetical protein
MGNHCNSILSLASYDLDHDLGGLRREVGCGGIDGHVERGRG